ncbi:hypothetical protein P3L10_012773 [Capsicum annuum]
MMKNGLLLVRFNTKEGKEEALEGGIHHFDSKPLIVKAWTPEMDFSKEELTTVPIWIKMLGLDFKYWSAKSLSKIGSLIGKPIMVDKNTAQKIGLSVSKLLVEVKIGTTLPECVHFKNEKGQVIEQQISYDWKPTICGTCKKYGHNTEICRKNKTKEAEGKNAAMNIAGPKKINKTSEKTSDGGNGVTIQTQLKDTWVQVAGKQQLQQKTQNIEAKQVDGTKTTGKMISPNKQLLTTSNSFLHLGECSQTGSQTNKAGSGGNSLGNYG